MERGDVVVIEKQENTYLQSLELKGPEWKVYVDTA